MNLPAINGCTYVGSTEFVASEQIQWVLGNLTSALRREHADLLEAERRKAAEALDLERRAYEKKLKATQREIKDLKSMLRKVPMEPVPAKEPAPSNKGKGGRFAGWNSFCKMQQKIHKPRLSKKELSQKWKQLSPEAKAKWYSYAAIKAHEAWVPPEPARLAHCVTCARSTCWKDEDGKRECGCWPCEGCACGLDEQCDPEQHMEEYRQYLKEQRKQAGRV